jgi:long-chain fatty acid transport protein
MKITVRIVTSCAVAALAIGFVVNEVQAGAFALREQSATGQGLSFAGAAAGGAGLGSMFWNPATITDFQGINASFTANLIAPYAKLTTDKTQSGATYSALPVSSGNEGLSAFVPAGYFSWQINSNVWAGMSINAPYGLATKPDATWGGRGYNSSTRVSSMMVTPTLAYRVNDMLSVAAGISYMTFKARYTSGSPTLATLTNPPAWGIAGMMGDGDAWGYTLGATLKPMQGTEIGLSYRSEMRVGLNGDFFSGTAILNHPVSTTVPLPQSINLGLKQVINPQWTLLAGLEWTNWSVLKAPIITDKVTNATHLALGSIPFYYKDGWFASLGAEYKLSPALTLRAGAAYEWSPIKDAERSARLPDNDRLWTSLGFGYQLTQQLNIDFGYTHIFPKSTKITINSTNHNYSSQLATAGLGNLVANADTHIDILSLGLTYRFDTPAPAAPLPNKVKK